MGTRATATIHNDDGELCSIYSQFDGYPDGFGSLLATFRMSRKIINGISDQTIETHANGMGCFAAQLISNLKTRIGGIYMHSIKSDDDFIDYHYDLYEDKIKCSSYGKVLFEGEYSKFLNWDG